VPEISRRQFAVYLVLVVLVVLVGGRALRAGAGAGTMPPGGLAAQGEPGTGLSGGGVTGPTRAGDVEVGVAGTRLVVHVAGAVRRPGVYELPEGARIRDALDRAGGGRAAADLDALNLAAKATDGQQVLVARRGRAGTAAVRAPGAAAAGGSAPAPGAVGGAAAPTAAGAPVPINQADAAQLETLNGVGPAIAAKIVDWRTQNGPFKTVDDLALVPGIGPKKLEAMRAQVVV
jgi:competence protein ComEA